MNATKHETEFCNQGHPAHDPKYGCGSCQDEIAAWKPAQVIKIRELTNDIGRGVRA